MQMFGKGISLNKLFYWSTIHSRPVNKEELFNLRHTSLWNVIERAFGILKQWFQIFHFPTNYNIDVQAQIPAALCAVHNFIHNYNKNVCNNDGYSDELYLQDDDIPIIQSSGMRDVNDEVKVMWDSIATAMWNDYQAILVSQADIDEDADSISSDTNKTVNL